MKARYGGGKKYYSGRITRVNADGTCAIAYDFGDRELRVKPKHIKAEGGGVRRSPSRIEAQGEGDAVLLEHDAALESRLTRLVEWQREAAERGGPPANVREAVALHLHRADPRADLVRRRRLLL